MLAAPISIRMKCEFSAFKLSRHLGPIVLHEDVSFFMALGSKPSYKSADLNRPARLLLIAAAMAIASISAWVRISRSEFIVTADKVANTPARWISGPYPAAQGLRHAPVEERITASPSKNVASGDERRMAAVVR